MKTFASDKNSAWRVFLSVINSGEATTHGRERYYVLNRRLRAGSEHQGFIEGCVAPIRDASARRTKTAYRPTPSAPPSHLAQYSRTGLFGPLPTPRYMFPYLQVFKMTRSSPHMQGTYIPTLPRYCTYASQSRCTHTDGACEDSRAPRLQPLVSATWRLLEAVAHTATLHCFKAPPGTACRAPLAPQVSVSALYDPPREEEEKKPYESRVAR